MSVGRRASPNAGIPAAIAPDITSTIWRPSAARRQIVGELDERGFVELARRLRDRRRPDLHDRDPGT